MEIDKREINDGVDILPKEVVEDDEENQEISSE